MTRARQLVAAVFLGFAISCGSGQAEVELPAGVERLPGEAVLVFAPAPRGPTAEFRPARDVLQEVGLTVRDDLPPFSYAVADGVDTGWADLAGSRSFQEAWAARPETVDLPQSSWLYVDLQALVDHGATRLAGAGERINILVEPLSLRTLEWAIAAVRDDPGVGVEVDGLLRSSAGEVGIAAVLGGAAAPSLLGPATAGELARLELRIDPLAARRTIDGWMAADQGGGALSIRDAMAAALGQVWQQLLAQFDGTVSVVVDAEGRNLVAVGLREPDDARDALDRFLRREGQDSWRAPGGRLALVDDARLLVLDGNASPPAPGGPPIDDVMRLRLRRPGQGQVTLVARRVDPRTLRVRLLFVD